MLAEALRLALAGFPVFPLAGKKPLTEHGFYDAATDPETVGELWRAHPGANIGLRTGGGLVVLDVDPRNGGSLEALGLDPANLGTVAARTGGGGWHLFYTVPSGLRLAGSLGAGLDVKADGGYVVAAPSIHPDTGAAYSWLPGLSPWDRDPEPLPPALLARLVTGSKPPKFATNARKLADGELSPDAGRFVALLGLLDIEADPHGGNFLTRCPFHDDHTPSFSVYPAKAAFFCHTPGCPAHGGGYYAKLRKLAETWLGLVVEEPQPSEKRTPYAGKPWEITDDDWRSCPACGTWHGGTDAHGRFGFTHHICGRPDCVVTKKRALAEALGRLAEWETIYTGWVDVDNWRAARDEMTGGDYAGIVSPDGEKVLVVSPIPTTFTGATPADKSSALSDVTETYLAGKGRRVRQAQTERRTPDPAKLRRAELRKLAKEDRALLNEVRVEHGNWRTVRAEIERGGFTLTRYNGRLSTDPLGVDDLRRLADLFRRLESRGLVRFGNRPSVTPMSVSAYIGTTDERAGRWAWQDPHSLGEAIAIAGVTGAYLGLKSQQSGIPLH